MFRPKPTKNEMIKDLVRAPGFLSHRDVLFISYQADQFNRKNGKHRKTGVKLTLRPEFADRGIYRQVYRTSTGIKGDRSGGIFYVKLEQGTALALDEILSEKVMRVMAKAAKKWM